MNTKWFVIFFIIALILLCFDLWWFSLAVLIFGAWVYFNYWLKGRNKYLRVFQRVLLVFIIFCTAIFIRLFLIEIYQIPSDSMNDTLISGDKVMVEKITYGPQMPSSPFEVPWVNLLFYLNKNSRTKIDSVWWKPRRLPGSGVLSTGDVVVFRRLDKKDVYLIKRCIGLPGDSLVIMDGNVFINNKQVDSGNGLLRNTYRIICKKPDALLKKIDKLGVSVNYMQYINDTTLQVDFSVDDCEQISKHFHEIKIEHHSRSKDEEPYCYPKKSDFKWNIDHFGPVWIPKKGATIKLNKQNYILYRKILSRHEKREIHLRDSVFFDGDLPISHYTFQKDYFFVMGDNRSRSYDSRYMGFIPIEGIQGKARLVLWSNSNDNYKISRVLRHIK